MAKVTTPIVKKRKICPKIVDCVFDDYSLNSITYRFLVFDSKVFEISNNIISDSRGTVFFKNIFPMKNKLCRTICAESYFDYASNKQGSIYDKACDESRRSKRRRKTKDFGHDF